MLKSGGKLCKSFEHSHSTSRLITMIMDYVVSTLTLQHIDVFLRFPGSLFFFLFSCMFISHIYACSDHRHVSPSTPHRDDRVSRFNFHYFTFKNSFLRFTRMANTERKMHARARDLTRLLVE